MIKSKKKNEKKVENLSCALETSYPLITRKMNIDNDEDENVSNDRNQFNPCYH